MLMRMARFALRAKFGWPRAQAPELGPGVLGYLRPWLEAAEQYPLNGRSTTSVGLQVNGPGGGQWELLLGDDSVAAAEQGLPPRPAATIYMNSKTFERLATRACSGRQAVEAGSVLVEGNGIQTQVVRNALEALAQLRRP